MIFFFHYTFGASPPNFSVPTKFFDFTPNFLQIFRYWSSAPCFRVLMGPGYKPKGINSYTGASLDIPNSETDADYMAHTRIFSASL